jgi:hypothetical protein
VSLRGLLIVYLAAWYLLAIVLFWRNLWSAETEIPPALEVSLALNTGQTIVGVGDNEAGMMFYIASYTYCMILRNFRFGRHLRVR